MRQNDDSDDRVQVFPHEHHLVEMILTNCYEDRNDAQNDQSESIRKLIGDAIREMRLEEIRDHCKTRHEQNYNNAELREACNRILVKRLTCVTNAVETAVTSGSLANDASIVGHIVSHEDDASKTEISEHKRHLQTQIETHVCGSVRGRRRHLEPSVLSAFFPQMSRAGSKC